MNFLKFRNEKKKLLVKFRNQNSILPKNEFDWKSRKVIRGTGGWGLMS